MQEIYDIIIIGAGPGGLSAALYALRSNRKTLLLDKGLPGGKLNEYIKLENYPGVYGLTAPELAGEFVKQIADLGLEVTYGSVVKVLKNDKIFEVNTEEETYFGKTVIVASGTSEKVLGIAGEKEFTGRGVSYCATCDGHFFKNQPVVVIGNNNPAARETLFLADLVSQVYFLCPSNFTIEDRLLDELKTHPKIKMIHRATVFQILGDIKVQKIKYRVGKDEFELEVKAIFPFIGSRPNTSFLACGDILDKQGFLLVNENMETPVPGLYGVGDATKTNFRQIITAASNGAIAAFKAQQYARKVIL